MAGGFRVNVAEKAKARKSTAPGEEDMPAGSGPMILHGSERAPGSGLTVPGWMKQLGGTIGGMFGKRPVGRPAAMHPAEPDTMTAERANQIYNKYVKR